MARLKADFEKNGGRFKEWKIEELFEIVGIKQAKSQRDVPTDNSGVPYIVQSISNNMCNRNVNKQWLIDHNEAPVQGNAIALGVTLPAVSYQPDEFGASQIITARANFLNEQIGLFFVGVLKKQMYQFSYAKKPGINIYKQMKLSLSTLSTGELAFEYMEAYIRELAAYLAASGLDDYHLTATEQNAIDLLRNGKVEMREFRIGELIEKLELKFRKKKFDKKEDVSKVQTKEFDLPLVNAKFGDNGIMYYGRSCDFDSAEMTIDIVNDGAISTGSVYPQPQRTGVLYNAYLVKLKDKETTPELLMYLSRCLEKSIKLKFGYENKAGWEKVKKENISLPILPSGEIDYAFMQHYISAVQKIAIKNVVLWKDRQIAAAKGVVGA